MKFTKYAGASALIAATLTFTGCTQDQQNLSHTNSYSKNQSNYGLSNDRLYDMGEEDGCNSMKGIVSEGIRNGNEVKYKNSKDYTRGFKRGMANCDSSGGNSRTARTAATAADLQDLVGARGRDGEGRLNDRGFDWVTTKKTGGSSYSFWKNRQSGQCISVRTADGRYAAIVNTASYVCDKR
jgi:hypothetical protein